MFIPLMMTVIFMIPGDDKADDVKILGRGNWKAPATEGAPPKQLAIHNASEYAKAHGTRESPQAALKNPMCSLTK